MSGLRYQSGWARFCCCKHLIGFNKVSLSHSAHLKSAGEVGRCCRARVLENLQPSVKHSRLEMNFCSTHCPELVTLPSLTQGGHAVQSYHMAGRAGNCNCSTYYTNLALHNTGGTLQWDATKWSTAVSESRSRCLCFRLFPLLWGTKGTNRTFIGSLQWG